MAYLLIHGKHDDLVQRVTANIVNTQGTNVPIRSVKKTFQKELNLSPIGASLLVYIVKQELRNFPIEREIILRNANAYEIRNDCVDLRYPAQF